MDSEERLQAQLLALLGVAAAVQRDVVAVRSALQSEQISRMLAGGSGSVGGGSGGGGSSGGGSGGGSGGAGDGCADLEARIRQLLSVVYRIRVDQVMFKPSQQTVLNHLMLRGSNVAVRSHGLRIAVAPHGRCSAVTHLTSAWRRMSC